MPLAHLVIVLPVTGYSFPATVNILSFIGKLYCDTRCSFFISVTENKFPVTKNIVYFTWKYPSVTDTPFVTGSFFLWHGYVSSCDRKCFSYYNKRGKIFLWSLGRLLRVFHFRNKCAGFTIKISCEILGFPGNLVPWFPGIIPPWGKDRTIN